MAGTGWQSTDLLTRFNQVAGRPTTDAITAAQKYVFLSDGQESALAEIAGITPRQLYGAPTAMTSSDGGLTWSFGTDGNGYALFPMGRASIYPSLNAIPDYPWRPGVDYLDRGTTVVMPNNIPWSGALYWVGITPPVQIDATNQPIIQPPPARTLIVTRSVQQFAEQFLRNAALADQMQIRWDRDFPKYMTMIRKHFSGSRPTGSVTQGSGYGGGGPGYGTGGTYGLGW